MARLRLANAVTRISAPSSSRIDLVMRVAMNSNTSGGASSRSWAAFFCRIAIRVSGVGRRDVGQQTPFEPGPQPILQCGQILGLAVGGDDDLLVRVVQRVEGMEELLLRPLPVLQELDVVDEQDVDSSR